MASTTYVDLAGPAIGADWLNDVNAAVYGDVANVKRDTFGAVGDGSADDTAAIQAAIDSLGANGGLVFLPAGAYKVTGELLVSTNRVHIVGAGIWATRIIFAPTANDTCLKFEHATPTLGSTQCSVRNLSFYSTDSTYVKTAIEVVAGAETLIEDISIGGSVVAIPGSTFWSDSTYSSVGLQIRGHEAGNVSRFKCYADYPIRCDKNPVVVPPITTATVIDLDSWVFRDLYLGAVQNHITFATGLNINNVQFVGRQNWVLGKYGFFWEDTTTTISGNTLVFENVRTEQAQDVTKGTFKIVHNYSLYNVVFRNCRPDLARPAYYLRKCIGVHFDSCTYESVSLVALDADATVDKISAANCFWQSGSTATLAGQRPGLLLPADPSGPLSPNFVFTQSSAANRQLRTGLAIFGSNDLDAAAPVSMAINVEQIIASGNAIGTVFISVQENASATFTLNGTAATTTEVTDPGGIFSNSSGTATSWNVYHNGTNYVLKHTRSGGPWRAGWLLIGSDSGV